MPSCPFTSCGKLKIYKDSTEIELTWRQEQSECLSSEWLSKIPKSRETKIKYGEDNIMKLLDAERIPLNHSVLSVSTVLNVIPTMMLE